MIGQVKHLSLRRPSGARRFVVVADEFHRFSGTPFHEILDQTPKGGLSLWLAHQNTSQVPSDLAKTIQAIDTLAFGLNAPDARLYSGIFDGKVLPETLKNLGLGEVYARIGSDIVNFTCPVPHTPDPALAAGIIRDSRNKYYASQGPAPVMSRQSRVIETFE